MHWTERVSYYVYHASAEENQDGKYHKSRRFESFKDAKKLALSTKADFVTLERHAEYWDGYYNEWCLDQDAGGVFQIAI